MFVVHCTMYNVYCTLYTVQCTGNHPGKFNISLYNKNKFNYSKNILYLCFI